MTAPRVDSAAITPTIVPAAPAPPAGASTTPTSGVGASREHFVMTRRRARGLVARAEAHGLPVPDAVREKAAAIPAEQAQGDTREAQSMASDRASVEATRTALDSAAQQLENEQRETEQTQTTTSEQPRQQSSVHPLSGAREAEQDEATRAGSRGKGQQRAPAKRSR